MPLGRPFRALKLWFLIHSYGLDGLRARLRDHVAWARALCEELRAHGAFEIVTEPVLSLFTFRLRGRDDAAHIAFVNRINDDGRIYITQTCVNGTIAVGMQISQFDTSRADIDAARDVLIELADASAPTAPDSNASYA